MTIMIVNTNNNRQNSNNNDFQGKLSLLDSIQIKMSNNTV